MWPGLPKGPAARSVRQLEKPQSGGGCIRSVTVHGDHAVAATEMQQSCNAYVSMQSWRGMDIQKRPRQGSAGTGQVGVFPKPPKQFPRLAGSRTRRSHQ
jgi:hypothetical protein